jgi:hypothetical protein
MKFKLFNLTLVCLATLGGLAPDQAAFAQGVEQQINPEQAQHLICVKEGQHLLCDIKKSGERQQQSAHQGVVKEAKAPVSLKSSTVNGVPQLLSPAQQTLIANILLGIGYLLPCGVCLGIFLYDKYYAYRSAVLKEQIEFLERLWQQSTQY